MRPSHLDLERAHPEEQAVQVPLLLLELHRGEGIVDCLDGHLGPQRRGEVLGKG